MFQLRGNATALSLRAWVGFLALTTTLVGLSVAVVSGPVVGALGRSLAETWMILTLECTVTALVASTFLVVVGRWAILPTWVLFVVLGATSSGGAVAPPLLPPVYEALGRVLPPGSAVEALRNAVYFSDAQHMQPSSS